VQHRGNLRQLQKESTRQRLLDAARGLFIAHGYARTKVEDITAAAGASTATFYLHFPAKRDIALEFAAEVHAVGLAMYPELEHVAYASTAEAVRSWLAEVTAGWDEIVPLWRVVLEAALGDDQVRAVNGDMHAIGIRALETGLRRAGRFTDGSEPVRAELAMTLHHAFFEEAVRDMRKIHAEHSLDILTRMWLAALAG
jgi:AcrR family transcriptional regulator